MNKFETQYPFVLEQMVDQAGDILDDLKQVANEIRAEEIRIKENRLQKSQLLEMLNQYIGALTDLVPEEGERFKNELLEIERILND